MKGVGFYHQLSETVCSVKRGLEIEIEMFSFIVFFIALRLSSNSSLDQSSGVKSTRERCSGEWNQVCQSLAGFTSVNLMIWGRGSLALAPSEIV